MQGKTINAIIKEIKGKGIKGEKEIKKYLFDNEYMPSIEQINEIVKGVEK